MAFSHKTLLIISISSLSLCAMNESQKEQEKSLIIHIPGNTNLYKLQDLYRKTHNTLDNYNPQEEQTIDNMLDIITRTQKLTPQSFNALKIFAYYNDHNDGSFNCKKYLCNKTSVTVCLERIHRYNIYLKESDLKLPKTNDFITYKKNHTTINAIRQAHKLNMPLDLSQINKETSLIAQLSDKTDFSKLNELFDDITKIKTTDNDTIVSLALVIATLAQKTSSDNTKQEEQLSNSSEEL